MLLVVVVAAAGVPMLDGRMSDATVIVIIAADMLAVADVFLLTCVSSLASKVNSM
jgi:hypothetical protein